MRSGFYFFKLFRKSSKRGTKLTSKKVRTEEELFDLLYEKENTVTQQGLNPPEYF